MKQFHEALNHGSSAAEYRIGSGYSGGDSLPKDKAEGAKWYRKAAEQGHAEAQFSLGMYYLIGAGKNEAEAAKWLGRATEQGNLAAATMLGKSYESGRDVVPKNMAEAAKWYRKAAEQGDSLAQAAQAKLGFDSDADPLAKMRNSISAQFAQFKLGEMYSKGDGVPKDYVEAYTWLNLAAAGGAFPESAKKRDALAAQMTPEAIAEAQRRSAAFVPRKKAAVSEKSSGQKAADN